MIVSEDQIKQIQDEKTKVEDLINKSTITENDSEYKTFKSVFNFEEKDDK